MSRRTFLTVLAAPVLATGLVLVGCSSGAGDRPPGTGSSAPAPAGVTAAGPPATGGPTASAGQPAKAAADRLEELRALPYIQFDPDTDPSLSGVTLFDPKRTTPGYNIYTNYVARTYLTDLAGKRVHEWKVPLPIRDCEDAEMLEDGGVLMVCVTGGLVRLDWDSNVLWDLKMKVHHDVAVRPDGTILALYHSEESYQGRRVLFDHILTLSAGGRILRDWSMFDHLDELKRHHEPSPLDAPPPPGEDPLSRHGDMDYYHTNTVKLLPRTPLGDRDRRFRAGNILISLRNVNTIAVLDQDDDSVTWSWGPGELELQHMPTMLPNGHILVFDNGLHRGFSRVVEVDPVSGRIVWEYSGDPPESFYSKWRGSAQRFDNGNTLICEADRGHAFEVTPKGKIVWEFWNTEFSPEGQRRRMYRLLRLPHALVDPLLAHGSRNR